MSTEFERWWDEEGSGMCPLPGEDAETHVKRVCKIAWDNGAFKALETRQIPSRLLPREAGFYWWRPVQHAAWMLIKLRGVPGFAPHAADEVFGGSFFGRAVKGWADDFPVGEWVAVLPPNAQRERPAGKENAE